MNPWGLQEAIYDRLTEWAPLVELLASDPRPGMTDEPAIFDHAPQDAVTPYVVVGDDSAGEHDTDDTTGADTSVAIHSFVEERGRKTTKQIQREIYRALHRKEGAIEGDGFRIFGVDVDLMESSVDPDGITRHGVTRFRVLTEETT